MFTSNNAVSGSSGGLRQFDWQGQKKIKRAPAVCGAVYGTVLRFLHWKGTLEGILSHHLEHWVTLESTSSRFVHWKGTLESTLPRLVHWKGTLEGTLSCFIYHRGIQEGTFAVYFRTRGHQGGQLPPASGSTVNATSNNHRTFKASALQYKPMLYITGNIYTHTYNWMTKLQRNFYFSGIWSPSAFPVVSTSILSVCLSVCLPASQPACLPACLPAGLQALGNRLLKVPAVKR